MKKRPTKKITQRSGQIFVRAITALILVYKVWVEVSILMGLNLFTRTQSKFLNDYLLKWSI